jgi:hypothetical protein
MVSQNRKVRTGKVVDLKSKEAVRPHVKTSLEDLDWVRSQLPCVQQLWLDCLAVEQFGYQQRELKTCLSKNPFHKAKILLEEQGLFRFYAVTELTCSGRTKIIGWKVENLHGYYNKKYWEVENYVAHKVTAESQKVTAESQKVTAESQKVTAESQKVGDETAETLTVQGSDFSQPRLNHPPTTPQPPTKVVGGGCSGGENFSDRLPSVDPDLCGGDPHDPPFEVDSLRSTACVGENPHTPLPPPPESDMVAPPPPCQPPLRSPLPNGRSGVDTEPPAALSESDHEGEGERMDLPATNGTVTPSAQPLVTNTIETSTQPLATLADQAEATGEDLGQDKCSGGSAAEISKLVDQICELAIAHGCPVEEAEKEEMNNFTLKKLEVTLDHLQRQMSQYSTHTKKQRLRFALGMGRWSRDN